MITGAIRVGPIRVVDVMSRIKPSMGEPKVSSIKMATRSGSTTFAMPTSISKEISEIWSKK